MMEKDLEQWNKNINIQIQEIASDIIDLKRRSKYNKVLIKSLKLKRKKLEEYLVIV